MKKKILSIIICGLLLLTACTQKNSTVDHKKDNAGDSTKVSEENTITWAIRDDDRISEDNIKKTNQLLVKKGYDLAIKLKRLSADGMYEKQEIYHTALEKAVKAKEVDVAYLDIRYETAPGEMAQYLQSGLFYPLTKWLHSKAGADVYKLYDKEMWEGNMVEGVNYTFPNETYYDVPRSLVAFRKDHVSKKLIKSWDGSWEDLLRIMDKVKLSKEDIMLAGFPEMDFFEGRVRKQKYMIDDYIVYNIQNKTVHQPFELKEFYEYESFLHKCYQKGYIKNHGMDSCESSEDEIKQMAQGKYAIAWQADERLSASEHVFSRGAVCVQGTLGEGTAVSAYSDKKEKALQLVKILRTDDEVANTLIWGEGDAKKLLDRDGYVKKSVESNRSQATFGINDGIFQKKEDMPPAKNMRKYRDKLRHYSPRTTSRLLGFWPDYSDFYEELLEYQNTLKENMDCFQEKDFEKSYQKAAKRVEKAWKPVEKVLQDQIRKWDTNRKK